ncbi:MAG TPA: S8 family serine peptidase, partial [Rugosimonospora sp.]|nr:S8 family serine peptidase [Rugosimonospora sp.]
MAALLGLTVVLGLTVALGLLVGPPARASAAPAASTQGYQKYYAVAKSYQGKPENLAEIAGRFLGSTDRAQEIFDLNAGRKQPDGGTLTDPDTLHAGWYLVLPWDAYGTGVQYGLVPTTAPATGPTKPPAKPPASAPPPPPSGTCAAAKSATGSQSQWGALRVAPQNAWNYSRGAGVVVAVVDSGVDASLAALSGRVTVGTDIVSGTGRGDTDCLGTGTAMASIIAAGTDSGAGQITGIAP